MHSGGDTTFQVNLIVMWVGWRIFQILFFLPVYKYLTSAVCLLGILPLILEWSLNKQDLGRWIVQGLRVGREKGLILPDCRWATEFHLMQASGSFNCPVPSCCRLKSWYVHRRRFFSPSQESPSFWLLISASLWLCIFQRHLWGHFTALCLMQNLKDVHVPANITLGI